MHSIPPDATIIGLMQELGWKPAGTGENLAFTDIAPTPLKSLAQTVQQKLGLSTIRIVGDLDMPCQRVAIMPGSPPASYQIGTLRGGADVLIAGEINEWETNEYTRDANLLGQPKGLIVIGHAASKEPGMRLMTQWISERIPNTPSNSSPPSTHSITSNPAQILYPQKKVVRYNGRPFLSHCTRLFSLRKY